MRSFRVVLSEGTSASISAMSSLTAKKCSHLQTPVYTHRKLRKINRASDILKSAKICRIDIHEFQLREITECDRMNVQPEPYALTTGRPEPKADLGAVQPNHTRMRNLNNSHNNEISESISYGKLISGAVKD